MKQGKILIIDDNEDVLFALNLLLEPYVEQIRVTTQPERIEHFMESYVPDVILLDMNFRRDAISGQEGFFWLEKIKKTDPDAVVLFITAYADTEKAVRAIKAGATDFIPKPWEKEKLLATLSAALKLRESRTEVRSLKRQVAALESSEDDGFEIIGESNAMQEIFTTIEKLRDTDANILILGENGTGKDLVARALYHHSPRNGQVFVGIDLGSIPEQLFESELFGYEKGAFTDARRDKPGRMEVATGGTLFLDEIGNLSLPMQAKLLTAIEKQQITRLGATRPITIDVRLISATNINIHEMVGKGTFRQDLLYRINTIELHIPPLRERGNDIQLLADYFLARYARKYKKDIKGLSRDARSKLQNYNWPGNVRELQHAIERAVILSDGMMLKPENFMLQPTASNKIAELEELNLSILEKEAIERALRRAEGNVTRAAELLGITRFALYRKLDKLGL
ncbi:MULTISPECIES: sigma-54-dependent transcriptional regulator [Parabacteroides]|uniref:DNA-binding NtrC family response regulator n=1 Tax=Parabacteroides faecis TaxID=1217282 RepID=A0ABR6KFY2_9BACT|nr:MULTISPECIES: sigma-54 dependent transcriptional regulator [Parabacteroides]MBB4620416.1 DNA-binding NtrC family response regulator [Parabacteroides faecis]MBC8616631.1 sigma-54-dependent Fis family transcriptional regulator [Parabacteroides faecis]MCS2891298.1 sigma-54 dependent transcriptional regulator [Parabacteroides faecis]RHR42272.1 sigma-54-dependent Fis family transcriptional regulator [Parabacteroides sp. AF18-52]RHR94183.1 sigma-54-dependent Fis family transcriptional regulator [